MKRSKEENIDFDARSALIGVGSLLELSLRQITKKAWSCVRAVPRVDGSLYFDLELGPDSFRLDWLSAHELLWAQPREQTPGSQKAILEKLQEKTLADSEFSILGFSNQDLKFLRFDEHVVDTLLSGRFVPGRTKWFAHVFEEAFQPSADRFTLSFKGPWGPVVLEICAASAASRGDKVYACELYNVSIIEDSRDHEQRKLLPHQVERFVAFCMARSVNAGMALQLTGARGEASSWGKEDDDNEPISTTRWGNPKQWYQFFSDFEIERSSLCSIKFTDPLAYVVHGEMECKSIEPFTFAPMVSYSSLPWPQGPVEHPNGSKSFFTGIDEQDAVFGASEKLQSVLDLAIRDDRICMVCLNNTCLPKIIGDDVSSVVKRVQAKTSIPIVTMNTDLHSPYETYQDMVRQVMESMDKESQEIGSKRDLSLVGFPAGKGRETLIGDLQSCGISVGVCVVPEFGTAALKTLSNTRAALIFPYRPWEDMAKEVLSAMEVPLKSIGSPYGRSGFRALVEAAVTACELDEDGILKAMEEHLAPTQDEWNALSQKAKEYRLAFVIDSRELRRFLEAREFYGVSILDLLEEMGFGVDILLKTSSGSGKNTQAPKDLVERSETRSIQEFNTKEELQELLVTGTFHAVYSEVLYDSRLLKAAKARFDLSMFELGIEGGMRSLRRMIRLCQWPFYRKYAKVFSTGVDC